MRYLFLLLLITACNPGSDHAQKVAAQALPRTTTKLQLASLRTYKVSASELARYFRTNPPAQGGHLVTYTCEAALPSPHMTAQAVFVDAADSVYEFIPERNLGLFAYAYGVDYRL